GSVSTPTDLPLASAHRLATYRVEWSRSTPSGPRHTPPDTRLVIARVSPPAPGGPSAQHGTRRSNLQNLPQRLAPRSTGLPSALPDPLPWVSPTVVACHSPLVCRRAVPLSAHSSWCAAIPVSLPGTRPLPWLKLRFVLSLLHPLPEHLRSCAPSSRLPPAHPSDRSGHTTHRTGTSVPAWPCNSASASAKRLSPAGQH